MQPKAGATYVIQVKSNDCDITSTVGKRVAVRDINTVETTSPEIGMHIDGKYDVQAQ